MDAWNAKKKSEINEKKRKLERVERVLDHINESIENGNFSTTYYDLDVGQVSILESIGYEVREDTSFGENIFYISWQNASYE